MNAAPKRSLKLSIPNRVKLRVFDTIGNFRCQISRVHRTRIERDVMYHWSQVESNRGHWRRRQESKHMDVDKTDLYHGKTSNLGRG